MRPGMNPGQQLNMGMPALPPRGSRSDLPPFDFGIQGLFFKDQMAARQHAQQQQQRNMSLLQRPGMMMPPPPSGMGFNPAAAQGSLGQIASHLQAEARAQHEFRMSQQHAAASARPRDGWLQMAVKGHPAAEGVLRPSERRQSPPRPNRGMAANAQLRGARPQPPLALQRMAASRPVTAAGDAPASTSSIGLHGANGEKARQPSGQDRILPGAATGGHRREVISSDSSSSSSSSSDDSVLEGTKVPARPSFHRALQGLFPKWRHPSFILWAICHRSLGFVCCSP